MQSFTDKENLLRALEKITLRVTNKNVDRENSSAAANKLDVKRMTKPLPSEASKQRGAENKCYNCNETGHIARNCSKPKRKRGSCFKCGATDHRLQACPQKKKASVPQKMSAQVESVTQISSVEEQQTGKTMQISNIVEQRKDNEFVKDIKIKL
ncbi:PREDICTED: protein lin-28 homolog B-like [Trachymyrmex cornetzi]|uniref:protein lin-28 homolog B-like n=1 Tax=Trachymyrmex cornetzi TaxID=471704 RepID=UPI00084EFEDD|nr:PREDICTED: protein lin-28 homolog B-like [Trachymyrmex cornetzi]